MTEFTFLSELSLSLELELKEENQDWTLLV